VTLSIQQDVIGEIDLMKDQLQQLHDCIKCPGEHVTAVDDALDRLSNTLSRVMIKCGKCKKTYVQPT